MTFTGIPRKAVISYGFDLSHLTSGVYPYLATYILHLKHMEIRTTRINATANPGYIFAGGATTLIQDKTIKNTLLKQVFHQTFRAMNVQNKITSSAGRGWKIGGVQQILNPTSIAFWLKKQVVPYPHTC